GREEGDEQEPQEEGRTRKERHAEWLAAVDTLDGLVHELAHRLTRSSTPRAVRYSELARQRTGQMRARRRPGADRRVGLGRRRCGGGPLPALALLARLRLAGGGPGRRGVRAGRCGHRQALAAVAEERVELVGLEGLLLDELADDEAELVPVLGEDLVRALPALLPDVVDLGVDDLRDVLAVVPLLLDLAAEEDELIALAVLERPELLAHAELRDHLARHLARLLDVVGRSGGDVAAQVQLLGDPAAQRRRDVVLELAPRAEVAVLLREGPGDAHGHAAGDDRDLVDRVGVLEQLEAQGVAGLVVGHDPLLLLGDDARAAL